MGAWRPEVAASSAVQLAEGGQTVDRLEEAPVGSRLDADPRL